MNILATLKRSRLNEKEARVYMSALENADSSITELARLSGLKRSTVHNVVEDLLMLGLLSEITKGKRRKFSAAHPRRLLQIARSVEHEIEEVLPELVALREASEEKPRIQVFEGKEGVEQVYKDIYQHLNNRKEMVGFTRIDALKDFPFALDEYKKVLRKVKNPKIRELNYGESGGKAWARELGHLCGKNHEIRTLPEKFPFGISDNLIYENKMLIFSVKKDVFVIIIESEEIVKTYKALFEWAWLQGKEV